MKRIIAAIVLMASISLIAGTNAPNPQFVLAWDRSIDDRLTNGISYTLYAENRLPSITNYVSISGLTNNTFGISGISSGTWNFYATARQGNIESVPSNVLIVAIPNPPSGLKTVIMQYSGVLTGPFVDGIFLRLLPVNP